MKFFEEIKHEWQVAKFEDIPGCLKFMVNSLCVGILAPPAFILLALFYFIASTVKWAIKYVLSIYRYASRTP